MSPDVLAMLNPDTSAKELYKPTEMVVPKRLSSPASARNTIPDPSDTYLAPQFRETFEQVALRIIDPTEPVSPVPSKTKVRSRVVDIRKDLSTRRTFFQVAAEHPRACLNGMSWNPATIHQPVPTVSPHLIIANSLVRDLTEILVVAKPQQSPLAEPRWLK